MIATLSPYQEKILDFFNWNSESLAINAVAGSGKSSTLVHICNEMPFYLQESSIFLAFNSAIAKELKTKLPKGMECSTIHSAGMKALRMALQPTTRDWVDDQKYRKIANAHPLIANLGFKLKKELLQAVLDAVNFCQLTLTSPTDYDAFNQMVGRFGITLPLVGNIYQMVFDILATGLETAAETISFTDMVWIPVRLNLPIQQYDNVLIDEAQDLSNCLRTLAGMIKKPTGRVISVGDPAQSIYGFAGAETDSFQKVKETFNSSELPLSVCYRCPRAHIALAQSIVPQIEAADGAKTGILEDLHPTKLMDELDPEQQDLVLSRTTSPLVRVLFNCIDSGKRVTLKGRDFLTQIINFARSVEEVEGYTWTRFPDCLTKLVEAKKADLQKKEGTEMQIEALEDRAIAMQMLWSKSNLKGHRSVSSMQAYLNSFATDENRKKITLSTIHRAKGIESDRVFFLNPSKIPHKNAVQPWEVTQEYNLKYVAYTRARRELYIVEGVV